MIDEPFGPDPSVAAPTQEHRLDRRRRAVTNAEVEKALAKITHLEPYFEVGFVVQTNGAKREPPADLVLSHHLIGSLMPRVVHARYVDQRSGLSHEHVRYLDPTIGSSFMDVREKAGTVLFSHLAE